MKFLVEALIRYIPYELIQCVLDYVSLEQLAGFGASLEELGEYSRRNPALLRTMNPDCKRKQDVLPAFYNWDTDQHPAQTWFLCHPTLFQWYLLNYRRRVFEFLEYRPHAGPLTLMALLLVDKYLDILHILYKEMPRLFTTRMLQLSLIRGQHAVFLFLIEKPMIHYSRTILYTAISRGYTNIVKYLHENNYEFYPWVMDLAAQHGHLEIVEFLYYNRNEGELVDARREAADARHPAIVGFLDDKIKMTRGDHRFLK